MPANPTQTCSLIVSADEDTAAIEQALSKKRVSVRKILLPEFLEITLPSYTKEVRNSDFICIVLDENHVHINMFILGILATIRKNSVVFCPPEIEKHLSNTLSISFGRNFIPIYARPSNEAAVSATFNAIIERFLRGKTPPKKSRDGSSAKFASAMAGPDKSSLTLDLRKEAADNLFSKLRNIRESANFPREFEDFVSEVFRKFNHDVVQGPEGNKQPDLIVWINSTNTNLKNPVIVEIKNRIKNIDAIEKQLLHQIKSSNAQSGIIITDSLDNIPEEERHKFPGVHIANIEEIIQMLLERNIYFDESVIS